MVQNKISVQIRAGYEIVYHCLQSTPMILMVHIHYSGPRTSSFPIA